ncbi:MAG: hypothetical protein WKF37_02255 [Bryobacteraceae bacterium]
MIQFFAARVVGADHQRSLGRRCVIVRDPVQPVLPALDHVHAFLLSQYSQRARRFAFLQQLNHGDHLRRLVSDDLG